ncbi:RNA polymerase sigma factor SigJ [Nitratireductor aquibiodomus RA22]|uniref:RNA polymerase sigma factor SigJ n=1 Tax=Nitratireductor aquibiodomus RA22 TaxID=1189611 RepID=I5C562_9HYPH|nr:sigma-70 family RNA polymerase sigma factor [Nitratireductor aquibiodomus]EIM76964.1 RNA polymerase sigma factor SigJ [Nitratireductor aquibiodomus RA22]
MSAADTDTIFTGLRPGLIRLAYRMLGSVADAEDIVQDAWLRWLSHERSDVREPAAFLRTIVTRLCVNELKSARRRRETYIGPWLPEPFFDPENEGELAEDITLPLMMALERLSPLERAAFLLHDVFGVGFEEISAALGRDAAACRKLASRARLHIHQARPRFSATKEEGRALATAFYTASRTGDMQALNGLLTKDVVIYTDGGGRVAAPTSPSTGIDAALKFFRGLARYFARSPSRLVRYATIDGLPGFITIEAGGIVQTSAILVNDGRIAAIYVTRNPEKLHHLARCGPH